MVKFCKLAFPCLALLLLAAPAFAQQRPRFPPTSLRNKPPTSARRRPAAT